MEQKDEEIKITEHAYTRAKERLSLSRKAIDRLAKKAFIDGRKHSDTTGQLNKYLTKIYLQDRIANNIRLYGEYIYLFRSLTLITVYQLPEWFRKSPERRKKFLSV
jgi:hypothetical protein